MTKLEKIQKIAAALERRGREKQQGENNAQFVTRILDQRLNEARRDFLSNLLREQIEFETPKEEVDVSDL